MRQLYNLVNAKDVFNDNNNGLTYGIEWLNEDGSVADCEWFTSNEERMNSIKQVNQ